MYFLTCPTVSKSTGAYHSGHLDGLLLILDTCGLHTSSGLAFVLDDI